MRAIVGGAPALQATRATVGGASDLCAAMPAQEGLSQSIRPLVARSDPIQGSPDQLPLLGLLDPTWVIQPPSDTIQTPFAQRTYCTRRRLLNGFSQLIELTNS